MSLRDSQIASSLEVELPAPLEPTPLVIVEGFLGGAGPLLWGNFEQHCNNDVTVDDESPRRRIIFASVGPVSSLHDRACELYYALKGGVVDYGELHSRTNGHNRYGRAHEEGLYPQWSRQNPLHFLGHSIGGSTIVKLQWLLNHGFFEESESADMILSVTAVSSPFRGTQAVYALGAEANNTPAVRSISIGSLLTKGVHLASYLAPYMPSFLDMHADARSLSYKEASFSSFLRTLWHSDWAESFDATPYDVTFEAAHAREACEEGVPLPSTFYRSYAACMTESDQSDPTEHHTPTLGHLVRVPPLYLLSHWIGSFNFSDLKHPPPFLNSSTTNEHLSGDVSTLWANDGVVPVFSQWHPLDCATTKCRHWNFSEATSSVANNPELEDLTPGVWNVYSVNDASHVSLVPFWLGTTRQCAFWKEIGRWLRGIDGQTGPCHRHADVLA